MKNVKRIYVVSYHDKVEKYTNRVLMIERIKTLIEDLITPTIFYRHKDISSDIRFEALQILDKQQYINRAIAIIENHSEGYTFTAIMQFVPELQYDIRHAWYHKSILQRSVYQIS